VLGWSTRSGVYASTPHHLAFWHRIIFRLCGGTRNKGVVVMHTTGGRAVDRKVIEGWDSGRAGEFVTRRIARARSYGAAAGRGSGLRVHDRRAAGTEDMLRNRVR